jgi:hypothetical protein
MPITGKQIADGAITSAKLAGSLSAQNPTVVDKDLVTAPSGGGSTVVGDKYILAGIGGAWSGGAINDIAEALDTSGTAWAFTTPTEGFTAWVLDEDAEYLFTGTIWEIHQRVNSADANVVLGANSANLPASVTAGATGNIVIGPVAAPALNMGASNIILGSTAAASLTDGNSNIIIGNTAAAALTTGTGNIIIGNGATATAASVGQLNIAGVIFGDIASPGTMSIGPGQEFVVAHGQTDNTDAVLGIVNNGTNGADVEVYVGDTSPIGVVTGNPGDLYILSDAGTASDVFAHVGAGSDNTSWSSLVQPPAFATDSTGVITGGLLSIGAPTSTFSISDGSGFVVDNTTVPGTPTRTLVTWSGETNLAVTDIATQLITYVSIDSAGTVIQRGTIWTRQQQRDEILLGVLVHVDNLVVNAIDTSAAPVINVVSQVGDIFAGLGFLNVAGNLFSPNGVNLNINKSIGVMMNRGIAWDDDPKNPNHKTLAALVAPSFQYRFLDGTNGATGTVIDPDIYDVGGTSTPVPVNQWTIQRVYVFVAGNVIIQPGQATYGNQADAIAAIQTEAFMTEPSIAANGLLRAFIVVQEGSTDLSDPNQAFFLNAGKFGETAGAGGLSVSTLQGAYDNSATNPEIATTDAGGALQIRRGTTGGDTDIVTEVQNAAGTAVFSVTGEGVLGGLAAPKAAQARRTTAYTLTTAFADVSLDTTDVETDAAVLDHDIATNSDNIIIGVAGTYLLYFEAEGEFNGTNAVQGRIRINDTTVVPGSLGSFGGQTHNQDHNYALSKLVIVTLAAGDFVTLQLQGTPAVGSGTVAAGTLFSAVRL